MSHSEMIVRTIAASPVSTRISLAELTEATGLSKPSLYAAFGDKEALYLKMLDRYVNQWLGRHSAVLERTVHGKDALQMSTRLNWRFFTRPCWRGWV